MLANLFKDERCQQLPAYGILEKMWVVPVLLLYSSVIKKSLITQAFPVLPEHLHVGAFMALTLEKTPTTSASLGHSVPFLQQLSWTTDHTYAEADPDLQITGALAIQTLR